MEGVVTSNSTYAPTHANVSSGLVSYTFGLTGACLTLDTACSTQLVAVHLARAELLETRCDEALTLCVGLIGPAWNAGFAANGMLSPLGRCHTFDVRGDGYARAEGCVAVLLASKIPEQSPERSVIATAV